MSDKQKMIVFCAALGCGALMLAIWLLTQQSRREQAERNYKEMTDLTNRSFSDEMETMREAAKVRDQGKEWAMTNGGIVTWHEGIGGSGQMSTPVHDRTDEEIAAAQTASKEKSNADPKASADEANAIRIQSAAAKALAANQSAADNGDAYGFLRMGERYRDGDGVEKDLAKAKDYLQKSADAGSPTAAQELSDLKP